METLSWSWLSIPDNCMVMRMLVMMMMVAMVVMAMMVVEIQSQLQVISRGRGASDDPVDR